MKKVLLLISVLVATSSCTFAGLYDDLLLPEDRPPVTSQPIVYGYNPLGDFVPTEVGQQEIKYGYNALGDYVPMSIGEQKIHYGYNSFGDFVPMSIGD